MCPEERRGGRLRGFGSGLPPRDRRLNFARLWRHINYEEVQSRLHRLRDWTLYKCIMRSSKEEGSLTLKQRRHKLSVGERGYAFTHPHALPHSPHTRTRTPALHTQIYISVVLNKSIYLIIWSFSLTINEIDGRRTFAKETLSPHWQYVIFFNFRKTSKAHELTNSNTSTRFSLRLPTGSSETWIKSPSRIFDTKRTRGDPGDHGSSTLQRSLTD